MVTPLCEQEVPVIVLVYGMYWVCVTTRVEVIKTEHTRARPLTAKFQF